MIETENLKSIFMKWSFSSTIFWFLVLLLIVGLLFWNQTRPPKDFPVNSNVSISRGLSASTISDNLQENEVVKSSGLLYLILLWRYDPASIQAGSYYFDKSLSVFEVAERITNNSTPSNLVALTLPEGFTTREFARLASEKLVNFDENVFVEVAMANEGFLFPDTYYIPHDYTEVELVDLLLETYKKKTGVLFDNSTSSLSEYEVITLASLLEREANTEESMRIIAGILLSRLEIPMRLQVDSSIEYVVGHKLNGTRAEDLKIDTPYNTYLYYGLPPTPIVNPGLTAIKAVLDPIETTYIYYITGNDGEFYYAETFEEHKANVERYLK